MANRLSHFRKWLLERRYFRVAWFAKDPQVQSASEDSRSELPDDIAHGLVAATDKLAIHPSEKAGVLDALNEAITQWQERPSVANNSMVVLGHPVSAISRILANSLNQLSIQDQDLRPINLLDWTERPSEMQDIQSQIEQKLSRDEDDQSSGADELIAQNLAVIPNLSWCFLRSAEGLEGVDYLRDSLLGDRTQFWIIGSGQVGWEYLKSTLKFHAYCGNTVSLPGLSGEALQGWLEPIVEQFDIRFNDASLHERFQHPDGLKDLDISTDKPMEALSEITQEVSATVQSSLRAVKDEILPKETEDEEDSSPKRDYFGRLADISEGVSIVALQLFIKSLRYREVKDTDDRHHQPEIPQKKLKKDFSVASEQATESSKSESSKEHHLVAITPKLPALPEVDQSDMYLLYSLMLHGDLTIRALAASLGDAPQVVNNQVQMLRNTGIVEQQGEVIKVNPVHYPKLRRELSRNNFMIEVP